MACSTCPGSQTSKGSIFPNSQQNKNSLSAGFSSKTNQIVIGQKGGNKVTGFNKIKPVDSSLKNMFS